MKKIFLSFMLIAALGFCAHANQNVNTVLTESVNFLVDEYPESCVAVSGLKLLEFKEHSATVGWSVVKDATFYVLSYKKTTATQWNDSIVVAETSCIIPGLIADSTYQVRVRMLCTKQTVSWSSVLSFTQPNKNNAVSVPFDQDFESNTTFWNIANATAAGTNKWYIGTPSNVNNKGKVAFISDDNGATNKYSGVYSVSHLWANLFFLDNPQIEEYLLSFDWRAFGGISYDALRIGFFGDITKAISGGSTYIGSATATENLLKRDLKSNPIWKTEKVTLSNAYTGTFQKMLFQWYNYNQATDAPINPPAAIDNILLQSFTCAIPQDLKVASIPNSTSLDLAWTATNKGNGKFNIFYRKVGESAWMDKRGLTKTNDTLTGLTANTDYEIRVQKQYSATDTSLWSDSFFTRTSLPFISPTFTDDFETFDNNQRALINTNQTNQWAIGTATFNGNSGKAAYISHNSGAANEYDITAFSISHLYYDIEFPDTGSFRLSFDWKGSGRNTDYLRVSLVEITDIPFAGQLLPISKRLFGKNFYNRKTWGHEDIAFPNNVAGTKKRLVFTWQNTGIGGDQPPVAIDNIKVDAFGCTTPENLKIAGNPDPTTLSLKWDDFSGKGSYEVTYALAGSNQWMTTTANLSTFDLKQLTANTAYDIKVKKICSADSSFYTASITGRTSQVPLVLAPTQTEDFESDTYKQWTIINDNQPNKWIVGANVSIGTGTHSLYVSNNPPANSYDSLFASTVHFYRDITFPMAWEQVLSFDWKGMGKSDIAYMNVYLTDISFVPKAGDTTGLGARIGSKSFFGSDTWRRDTIVVNDTIINKARLSSVTKRLIFTWANNGNGGTTPPIAVDNIKIQALQCRQPQTLKVKEYLDSNTVQIEFKLKNQDKFVFYAKEANGTIISFPITDTIATIKPLKPNTEYTASVQSVCASDSSRLSNSILIRMPQNYAQATKSNPFSEDFENGESARYWTIVNGTQPNRWFIGGNSYAPGLGNQGAYIDSTLDGTGNAYTNKTTTVHLYRDIKFDSAAEKVLSFDWKCKGNSNNYFTVAILNLDVIPTAGVSPTNIYKSASLYSTTEDWKTFEIILPAATANQLSGKVKRLLFTWVNNTSAAVQPPVTIDNVRITTADCAMPTDLKATKTWSDSIGLSWVSTGNSFDITYRKVSETAWSAPQNTTNKTFVIKGLQSNTEYEVAVANKCGGSTIPRTMQTLTKQKPVDATVEYFHDFTNSTENMQWAMADAINKWYIGNAVEGDNFKSAYISEDEGATNSYNTESECVSHIYRDFQFGSHAAYQFTFNWRSMGENRLDYLRVYLVDTSAVVTAGKAITGTPIYTSQNLNMSKDWNILSFQIKNTFINNQKKLVFSWVNDRHAGEQPPASFTNVEMQPLNCPTPKNLRVTSYPNQTSVVVAWDSVWQNTVVQYKQKSETSWISDTIYNANLDTIKNLAPDNTSYEIRVGALCSGNSYLWSETLTILTQQYATGIPFSTDFNIPEDNELWGILNDKNGNAWIFGNKAHSKSNDNAIYISNDGLDYAYTVYNAPTITHFYRDFDASINFKELEVAFDWRAVGDTGDYLQAYLVNTATALNAGAKLPDNARLFGAKLNNQFEWNKATVFKPKAEVPVSMRLVFSWVNDNEDGKQVPAAVDNVSVKTYNCLSAKNLIATKVASDSVVLAWTPQETGATYSIRYKETGTQNWTFFIDNLSSASSTVDQLNANTLYEFSVNARCSSGDTSAWISSKARTLQVLSAPTFTETFENGSTHENWTILSDQQENKWVIDSNIAAFGKYCAYVSNDGGKSNAYSDEYTGKTVYTHLYREIQFGNAAQYFLSFAWKSNGNESDYMRVYLVPESVQIKEGDSIAPKYALFNNKKFHGISQWSADSTLLDTASWKNTKARLVFTWVNDASLTTQTPAAVDNIKFLALDCKIPTNLAVSDYPSSTSLELQWKGEGNSFTVGYKIAGSSAAYTEKQVNDTITVITGLQGLTSYEIAVKNNCVNNKWSPSIIVKTSLEPFKDFPMVETFETIPNTNWQITNGYQASKWVIGGATYTGANSTKSMYISKDNGANNTYDGNGASIVHFYRDIRFPKAYKYDLSFDWKVLGNLRDRMQIHIVDVDQVPIAGEDLPASTRIGKLYYDSSSAVASWKHELIVLSNADAYSNQLKRLVFTWQNDAIGENQPPAAIDNITLIAYTCEQPTNVKAKPLSVSSAEISWDGSFNSYILAYRPTGYKEEYEYIRVIVNGKTDTIKGLQSGTNYEFLVSGNDCATGLGLPAEGKFSTPYSLPFFEDFSDYVFISGTTLAPPLDWFISYTSDFVTKAKEGIYINPAGPSNIALSKNNSWTCGDFAKKYGASKSARMGLFYTNTADWLITPQIDLGSEPGRKQIEFKLAIANYNAPDSIDLRGIDDKFGLFVSTDDRWSMENALNIWDASSINTSLYQINATAEGEWVRFYLDDYTGLIRIGFYGESTVTNGYTYLYVDSVLINNVTCKDVENITMSDIDLHSAKVNWQTADKDQYHWEIQYGKNPQNLQTIETYDDYFKILSNLDMGAEYSISIRPICDSIGPGNWSPVQYFQTKSTCAAIPDSIHVQPSYASTVVSWAAGINNVSWLVRYGASGENLENMTTLSANTPSCTIPDLNELTEYTVYVKAICSTNDTSTWSSAFKFTTTIIPCDSVWNLRTSGITASTATLLWDAKNAGGQFEILYGTSNDLKAMKSVFVNAATSYNAEDLANNNTYYFYVRAICRANDTSSWSIVGSFKTNECPLVDAVYLVSLNSDSTQATVNWNRKPGQTDWSVSIAESGAGATEERAVDTFYVFKNLEHKRYEIAVNSRCGDVNEYTAWTTPMILDLTQTGINTLLVNGVKINITPNPAKDHATLFIEGAEGIITVSIVSVKGEVVVSEQLKCEKDTTKELSLTGLSKGTYIVRLVHDNWSVAKKLIVQ